MFDCVEFVDVEDYDGYVYDLSVEDNENFFVGFGLVYVYNSYYGYYGYVRVCWYCKECVESVMVWGREYIMMIIKEIEEKYGFKVIYSDIDGFFVIIFGVDVEIVKKKVMEFFKYINVKFLGVFEFEYEGFYKCGFFVMKKKYVVIDEEGKIIMCGFEIVRCDWSEIVKEM